VSRDLVFIGDVHLERGDPAVGDFVAFLDRLSHTAERIVLMGDLFRIWIGGLEQPHQSAVIDRMGQLARRGVRVRYIEGNRDYRVGSGRAGGVLDRVSDRALVEEFGGRRLYVAHGDGIHPQDVAYRTWRAFSRSSPLWAVFGLLPRGVRARLADAVERRMAGTNQAFKQEFPEAVVRAFADPYLAAGHDAVVLGHFHVEKDLDAGPGHPGRRILVLPEWKGSRRHLRVSPRGDIAFVDSA
jgi:UDP-2,3-diacylglucosamine hydrolase